MPEPLMVYDGECGFCKLWIERWKAITGETVDYAPYQDVSSRFPDIPRERFQAAVHLLDADGNWYFGAQAVFRALAGVRGYGWMYFCYRRIPGVGRFCEWMYRRIAGNRPLLYAFSRLLWGSDLRPPQYTISRWLFLRALAIIYLIAFISLGVQILGLAGSHGILPVQDLLNEFRNHLGSARFWWIPTIFWWNSSDWFLQCVCGLGVVCSLLLIFGILPTLNLFLLWFFYLSLCVAGDVFLAYQWDVLLLETGFLSIFLIPPDTRKHTLHIRHSKSIQFLLRWLLFRLMFSSGMVKLLSGDPAWSDWTALTFHYETQPLPTWIGWYVHLLPDWFHITSAFLMFVVEIILPFFIFAPRRLRLFACFSFVFLQGAIALTGNYAFFNLLTGALCLLLIDDVVWPQFWRKERPIQVQKQRILPAHWLSWPIALFLFFLSIVQMSVTLGIRVGWPNPVWEVARAVSPLRIVNRYGLFAIMTTSRPEIIIEGSRDGEKWIPYEFKYKPGDVSRKPGFIEPHQPRLDWQMWFAALSNYRQETWFIPFTLRLLQGSKPVLELLERNPFPDDPPKYIRAVVYDYRFSDWSEENRSGIWWTREYEGPYCPVMSLPEE